MRKKLLIFSILAILLIGILGFLSLKNPVQEETQQPPIPIKVEGTEKQILLKNPHYANNDLDAILDDEVEPEVLRFNLKSHPNVNYIKQVGLGKQVVIWYDTNSVYALQGALGEPIFINKRTGQITQRDWRYIVWENENYQEPVYSCSNQTSTNGTITQSCIQTSTQTKTKEVWLPYNSKDISSGKQRIGIEVEVLSNDLIDGIWVVGGKQINRHAIWENNHAWYDEFITNTTGSYNRSGAVTWNSSGWVNVGDTGVTERGEIYRGEFNESGFNNTKEGLNYTVDFRTIDVNYGSLLFHLNTTNFTTTTGAGYILGVGSSWINPTLFYTYNGFSNRIQIGINSSYTLLNDIWYTVFIYKNASSIIINLKTRSDNITRATITATNNTRTSGYLGAYAWDGIIQWDNLRVNPINLQGDLNIILLSPINNTNVSTITNYFTANVINNSINPSIFNVTIEVRNTNGTLAYNNTNISKISGIYNWTGITLPNADYNWTVFAYGNNSIKYNATDGILFFRIDTIFPSLNVTAPTNGTNFNYLTYGQNITLDSIATDSFLSTCWYNYNLTNKTFTCISGNLVSQNLSVTNQPNITVYANDTAKNLNSSSISWTYSLFDFNNYTYNMNVTESAITTISGHFQTGSAISSAYLQYNNTNYTTSISSLGENQYIISATPTVQVVSSNVNISWFFWVNNINATPYNQTILNIDVGNCSSYAFTLVNYSLLDEGTQTLINNSNSTIESTIRLTSNMGEIVVELNKIFTGNSTPRVCSAINLSSLGLRLWEQSRYGSTNYVYESHNIQNRSITTTPIDILLFDLPSIDATTFRITYKSITFLPVPDAVVEIYRKYLGEGIYKNIESPITDDNGEASASFDLNAVLYKIIISINGTTLSTFINPAVACANILTGECNILLNERQSVILIDNLDVVNDFSYGLTQNNRTIRLSYTIPSGNTKLVNLLVNQTTILGNKTTCNQTLFATSGQIDCVVADSLGDVFTSIYVYSGGKLLVAGSSIILEDRSIYFGTDNIILTFFLVLSLILLTVSSPIAVLFSIVIGLIASSLMLFLNSGSLFGTASVLVYVVIIVFILVIKISNRDK